MKKSPLKTLCSLPIGPSCALLFLGSLSVLAFAKGAELIGGYQPCPFCLQQRWGYYTTVLLLPIVLFLQWRRERHIFIFPLLILCAISYLSSSALAIYQTGMQQGIWIPADACLQSPFIILRDSLTALKQARSELSVTDCARIDGRILGLSFAFWNSLIASFFTILTFLIIYKNYLYKYLNIVKNNNN